MLRCRQLWRLHNYPATSLLREQPPLAGQPFSTFSIFFHKSGNHLPPRPTLSDSDIKETYVKGTGPGGQKINKTNSAAQLTHIPTGIVVKCQVTRSKNQNYTIARRLLAEKVDLLEKGDESRTAKVVERKSRKKRSADKKKRRKYRQLAEEKDGQEEELVDDQDDNAEECAGEEVEGENLNTPEGGHVPKG